MFILLSALGVSGVQAQTFTVDTSVYSNAAYPGSVNTACDDVFGAASIIDASYNYASRDGSSYNQPVLLHFEEGSTIGETVTDSLGGSSVQVFSDRNFQVMYPNTAAATVEALALDPQNDVTGYAYQPNGVKVSTLALDLLSGDVALTSTTSKAGQTTNVLTIVAELADSATAPDLDQLLAYYDGGCARSFFPFSQICSNLQTELSASTCLSTISISALNGAGSGATATSINVDTNRVAYTFDDDTVTAEQLVFYMALLANEPEVLFVEPTVSQQVLASRVTNDSNGGAALTVVEGDPAGVAEGFGVSGQCSYLHDRNVDGTGEVVAIIDNGILLDSTFFYDPDDSDTPCSGTTCCSFSAAGGCADLDASCEQSCYDLTDSDGIGGSSVDSDPEARKILSFVPLVDRQPAAHGTMVASTVIGSPLSDRELGCGDDFEAASDIRGVASGAEAVFIDAGREGDDMYLDLPIPSFRNVLQELAYDNNNANEVVLAFGGESNGAADSVTRDINDFIASNSDAIVVSAAGGRDSTNGNVDTALAKNGISVGVFSVADTPVVSPTLSVQFSTTFLAGTDLESTGAADTENYCGTAEFSGSSAATAVVAGQVALIEHYIKREEVTVFHYDGTGGQTVTAGNGYTGATIKAVLVAAANTNDNDGAEHGNGYGVPTLENVLPFDEEHQTDLRLEVHTLSGTGGSASREITVTDASKPLIVALAYDDLAPSAFSAAADFQVVNDVRLTLATPPTDSAPNGNVLYPNGETDGSAPANTLQKIVVAVPVEGTYTVTVAANFVSTQSLADQDASLVVSGRFSVESVNDGTNVVTGQDAGEVTDVPACCPYGTILPTTSCFSISFLVLIVLGCIVFGLVVICIIRSKLRSKETSDEDE